MKESAGQLYAVWKSSEFPMGPIWMAVVVMVVAVRGTDHTEFPGGVGVAEHLPQQGLGGGDLAPHLEEGHGSQETPERWTRRTSAPG